MVQELIEGRVVLFAGAGISTEGGDVLPYTFYEDVRNTLHLDEEDLSFPDLMQRLCNLPNGRAKLLRKIKARFDYIHSFPELYRVATRFHKEFATLFHIENIITTNWDDYFEQECGATPFVTPEDYAFWDIPGRKVFKIHGSMNNPGSIVATASDYENCYTRLERGVLGSTLKLMLSTKTILYVGYSCRDEDFLRIHSILQEELGSLLPQAYIITLDEGGDERFRALGLIPIVTDATHFIRGVKEHLLTYSDMLPDDRFHDVARKLYEVKAHHDALFKGSDRANPATVYAAYYQDGLQHAFERILALRGTGVYSHICNVWDNIQTYQEMRATRLKTRKYSDVAYIEGYRNGLIFLVSDDEVRETLPLYFMFGVDEQPITLDEFINLYPQAEELHRTAYRQMKRKINALSDPANTYWHHKPTIF